MHRGIEFNFRSCAAPTQHWKCCRWVIKNLIVYSRSKWGGDILSNRFSLLNRLLISSLVFLPSYHYSTTKLTNCSNCPKCPNFLTSYLSSSPWILCDLTGTRIIFTASMTMSTPVNFSVYLWKWDQLVKSNPCPYL